MVCTEMVWAPPESAKPSAFVTLSSGTTGLVFDARSKRRSEASVPSVRVGVEKVVSAPELTIANDAPLPTVTLAAAAKGLRPSVPDETVIGPANVWEPRMSTRPGPAFTSDPEPDRAPATVNRPARLNSSEAPEATAIAPARPPDAPPAPIRSVPAETVVPPVASLSVAITAVPLPVFTRLPLPVIRPRPVNDWPRLPTSSVTCCGETASAIVTAIAPVPAAESLNTTRSLSMKFVADPPVWSTQFCVPPTPTAVPLSQLDDVLPFHTSESSV